MILRYFPLVRNRIHDQMVSAQLNNIHDTQILCSKGHVFNCSPIQSPYNVIYGQQYSLRYTISIVIESIESKTSILYLILKSCGK